MFAVQCRGEAFAVIWHTCIHTQTSKCFAPTFQKTKLLRKNIFQLLAPKFLFGSVMDEKLSFSAMVFPSRSLGTSSSGLFRFRFRNFNYPPHNPPVYGGIMGGGSSRSPDLTTQQAATKSPLVGRTSAPLVIMMSTGTVDLPQLRRVV